jgi:carbamoyltransferase
MLTRRVLPKALKKKPICYVEHHLGHAAAAWKLSGFDDALILSVDGMGDGLSLLVMRSSPGRPLERLWEVSSRDSLGLFFQVLTEVFGFVSCRDEGKITGLAAGGSADNVDFPFPFEYVNEELRFTGKFGFGKRGIDWAKKHLGERYAKEDLAAWAQDNLEKYVVQIARRFLKETGLTKLAITGGVAANVKLNQRLHAIDEVEELFVLPNMGDGGLGLGAICAQDDVSLRRATDVFWGESFTDDEIEAVLKKAELPYKRVDSIEEEMAALLAKSYLVARFTGRMEWGPRALGNRSILAQTTDSQVVQRLNTLLQRSDFMPFAPAVLAEDLDLYCLQTQSGRHAAEFMTVCFDCTDKMKDENPAIVHVDGTARAQAVRAENNPSFHKVLQAFKNITGSGVLLNTSFNVHEEPIVRTPEEAVSAFKRGRLDYLAIGPFLMEGLPLQEGLS